MPARNGLTEIVLSTSTGGTLTTRREPKQDGEKWKKAIANSRFFWKSKYGVTTAVSYAGDVATITVLSGLDKSPAAVADMLERKSVRHAVKSMQPKPEPPKPAPEPELVLDDDESREFFKEMYQTSFRAQPLAPASVHESNARAAVVQFRRRFHGG